MPSLPELSHTARTRLFPTAFPRSASDLESLSNDFDQLTIRAKHPALPTLLRQHTLCFTSVTLPLHVIGFCGQLCANTPDSTIELGTIR